MLLRRFRVASFSCRLQHVVVGMCVFACALVRAARSAPCLVWLIHAVFVCPQDYLAHILSPTLARVLLASIPPTPAITSNYLASIYRLNVLSSSRVSGGAGCLRRPGVPEHRHEMALESLCRFDS